MAKWDAGHFSDISQDVPPSIDPEDDDSLHGHNSNRGVDGHMDVCQVEQELTGWRAENHAQDEAKGTNEDREDFPGFKILVEIGPEVVLDGTDHKIQLEELCREANSEEYGEESNEK